MPRWISVVCLIVIAIPPSVSADEDILEKREAHILELCQESVKGVASLQLSILIDDLDRALQLKPTVRRRLELAAKGAAQKYAVQQIQRDKQVISRQMNENLPPDADHFVLNRTLIDLSEFKSPAPDNLEDIEDTDEPADDSEIDIDKIYPRVVFRFHDRNCGWNFRRKNGSSGYGVSGGFQKVLETEPWNRTYDELISEEDRNRYESFRIEQATVAVTDMLSGYLDLRLRLTSDQKPKVKAWLAERIKVERIDHMGDYHNLFVNTVKSLPQDGLDAILNDTQLAAWKEFVKTQ